MRHRNRYQLPKEETRNIEFKLHSNYIKNLDPNDITEQDLKKLIKLTSK